MLDPVLGHHVASGTWCPSDQPWHRLVPPIRSPGQAGYRAESRNPDRLIERGGIKKALAKSKFDAASILGRVVFYAIMLVVLSMAFGIFGNNPVSTYLDAAVAYLPKVFVAILIIVVA